MTGDLDFPITLRMGAVRKSGILALGVAFLVVSFFMFGESGTTRVPIFGHVTKHNFSFFMFAVGAIVAVAAVNAFVTGRPNLVLNADGLVFTPNLASARRLAWSEVVEITTYDSRYGSGVAIRTRAGRVRKIPVISKLSPAELRDLMQRCVEAWRRTHKTGQGSAIFPCA